MPKASKQAKTSILDRLVESNYLFRGMDLACLSEYLSPDSLKEEKLFSNRPVYTAFLPNEYLDVLYLILEGGPVIVRSTPLDRVIGISYSGSCFGMNSLPFSYGLATKAFPSLVEAYKTTYVLKVPLEIVQKLYENNEDFRDRYRLLFELRAKFHYHLLNCSNYPPQAVASLLRALIYQERELGNQPNSQSIYTFDLSVDLIAKVCQLNQRTVEQVLKGMQQVGLLASVKASDPSEDTISVVDAEGLKEVYSTTRDKVPWWPLR